MYIYTKSPCFITKRLHATQTPTGGWLVASECAASWCSFSWPVVTSASVIRASLGGLRAPNFLGRGWDDLWFFWVVFRLYSFFGILGLDPTSFYGSLYPLVNQPSWQQPVSSGNSSSKSYLPGLGYFNGRQYSWDMIGAVYINARGNDLCNASRCCL